LVRLETSLLKKRFFPDLIFTCSRLREVGGLIVRTALTRLETPEGWLRQPFRCIIEEGRERWL
jgi:hypothetical protein